MRGTLVLSAIVLVAVSVVRSSYVGCYKDQSTRAMTGQWIDMKDSNNIQTCRDFCKRLMYSYAGLQFASHCFCGDTYATYGVAPASQCSHQCSGKSSEKCGGSWRNSVHRSGYRGCYKDQASPRDMQAAWFHMKDSDNSDIDVCIGICKTLNYKYAGLQAGAHCFCDNSFGTHGSAPKSECSSPCTGNSKQKCGGGWRNSIFETGV